MAGCSGVCHRESNSCAEIIAPDLDVFEGHYPDQPVLPGVLQCEAAFQAGAVLIAKNHTVEPGKNTCRNSSEQHEVSPDGQAGRNS